MDSKRHKELRIAIARHALQSQVEWMRQCGGNLSGYVDRYGSVLDAGHYGDGAEKIFSADCAELKRLEEKLSVAVRGDAPTMNFWLGFAGASDVDFLPSDALKQQLWAEVKGKVPPDLGVKGLGITILVHV